MIKNTIINKIKKIPLLILGIILAVKNSIYAVDPNFEACMYGVVSPEIQRSKLIKDFLYYLTIPIILIVGLIVYWKRSKRRKVEKISIIVMLTILAIVIQVLLFWIIQQF